MNNKVEELKEKFKDHELTHVIKTKTLNVFEYRNKNGSGIYHQRWIVDRGTLIVTGDCYDAIYTWNSKGISLKFLAECGLGYFMEKCRADKDGSMQREYNEEAAREIMLEHSIEYMFEKHQDEIFMDKYFDNPHQKWDELSIDKKFEVLEPKYQELGIDSYSFNQERQSDAYDFMMSNDEIFGSDAWEIDLTIATTTPKIHLAALKSAFDKYPNAF